MLKIDGSFGEGGGAILRVSAGLACTLQQPLYITNIRKNRSKPGIRLQHLIGLQALEQITDGSLSEAAVGSTDVNFVPGSKWNSEISVHIATAGNIGLLTQTLQNALIRAPEKEYIINVDGGGTYGTYAPGTEYLNNVTFSLFRHLGYDVRIDVPQQGFYPKGGAKAVIRIHPNPEKYQPLVLEERGELESISGIVHVEERLRKPRVGERIATTIRDEIIRLVNPGCEIDITCKYCRSRSPGVGVDCWVNYGGGIVLGAGTIIGKRGVSSEKIGTDMAHRLRKILDGDYTVDEYASDQLLPLLSLIDSSSSIKIPRVTSHCETNIALLKKMVGRDAVITKNGGCISLKYL